MPSSNEVELFAALATLTQGLDRFLTEVCGTSAWTTALAEKDAAAGIKGKKYARDAQAGLRMLTERGQPFSSAISAKLTPTHINYARELREIRNGIAHQERFSDLDTCRALDTMNRILVAMNCPEEALIAQARLKSYIAKIAVPNTLPDKTASPKELKPDALSGSRHQILPTDLGGVSKKSWSKSTLQNTINEMFDKSLAVRSRALKSAAAAICSTKNPSLRDQLLQLIVDYLQTANNNVHSSSVPKHKATPLDARSAVDRWLDHSKDVASWKGTPLPPLTDPSGESALRSELLKAVLPYLRNSSKSDLYQTILEGMDLRCVDLRRIKITGVVFEDTDLSGSNLSNSILESFEMRNVDLNSANFDQASISNGYVYSTTVSSASFIGASIDGVAFYSTEFVHCIFRDTDFLSDYFDGGEFTSCNLRGITSRGTYFGSIRFNGNTIDNSAFAGSSIDKCNFKNQSLEPSALAQAEEFSPE